MTLNKFQQLHFWSNLIQSSGFPNVGKSSLINSLKGILACNAGIKRGTTKWATWALKTQAFSLGSSSLHIYSLSLALYICCLSIWSTVAWLWPPQIHAGGAHLEESEANGQPRSRGLAVQPSIFDGSEGASGGGPGECPGGRQGSAQTVRQDTGGRSSCHKMVCQSWSHGCNCFCKSVWSSCFRSCFSTMSLTSGTLWSS